MPEYVKGHPSWSGINRIFRVGFQPSIDQRFQSAPDLIERLDEIISPTEEQNKPTNYEADVSAIQDLLNSTIAIATQQIEDAIYSVSSKLIERIRTVANKSGLGVSTGDWRVLGEYVVCHFLLHVPGRGLSSEEIFHRIELEKPNRSFVAASYRFGQETDKNAVTYYRRPAADTERLEEEVLSHAEEMFQILAQDLRTRLERASI